MDLVGKPPICLSHEQLIKGSVNQSRIRRISSRCFAIRGEAKDGCHFLRQCFSFPGHLCARWTIVFGWVASVNTSNVSLIISFWKSFWFGRPRGWPKGNSIAAALGTPYCSAQVGIIVTRMVLSPPDSNKRARTSTSLQQPGQAGVRSTVSTSSDCILASIIGPYIFSHGSHLGPGCPWYPITE